MATTSNPRMDHSPPVAPPAQQDATPDDKTSTVAEQQLSNTLLSYSHSDWDRAQRADPLCDVTRRYIQLGHPSPLPRFLCDHLPSHTRPEIADIADLARKAAYYRETMTPHYWFRNPLPTPWRLRPTTAAEAVPLLMTPFASTCRTWPDRGSCTHATPMLLATSVSHAHSKCWNASTGGSVWKSA